MQVGKEEQALPLVLHRHPLLDRAEVVAEVQVAGGLDAAGEKQDARDDEKAFNIALSVLGSRVNADRGVPFAVLMRGEGWPTIPIMGISFTGASPTDSAQLPGQARMGRPVGPFTDMQPLPAAQGFPAIAQAPCLAGLGSTACQLLWTACHDG